MEVQENVDISLLSLEERVTHKVWKVRLNGWEELANIFRTCPYPDDPNYTKYSHFIKSGIGDVNAIIQEKALEALETFLSKSNEGKR
jgi:hypothetical protein